MQPAPAVSVVCRDRGAWRVARTVIAAAAAANLAAWCAALSEAGTSISVLAAFVAGLGSGFWIWRSLRAASPTLAWDGQCWQLDGVTAQADGVSVTVDLGGWMLLRIVFGPGRLSWVGVSEGGVGPGWWALRCALFARSTAAPGQTAL